MGLGLAEAGFQGHGSPGVAVRAGCGLGAAERVVPPDELWRWSGFPFWCCKASIAEPAPEHRAAISDHNFVPM